MLKDMDFYHLQENITNKYWIKICSKNVSHKTGEFIGNKIADAVTKSKDNNIDIQKPVAEIFILPEKRKKILNKLRKVL